MVAGRQLSDGNTSGTTLGQSTTDTVGLYGFVTAQPADADLTSTVSLFALTGASAVANTSSTVSGIFGFNSTLYAQLFDALAAIRTALVATGVHKGGA